MDTLDHSDVGVRVNIRMSLSATLPFKKTVIVHEREFGFESVNGKGVEVRDNFWESAHIPLC